MPALAPPRAWLSVVVLTLAACDQQALFDRFVPKQEAALGRRVFTQLQRREFEPIETALNPTIGARGNVRPQLEELAAMFPAAPPLDVRIVGASTRNVNGTRTVSLTYEYQYPAQWLLASIVLRQADGRQIIDSLYMQPTPDSQERINAFTFHGKGWKHYAILFCVALIPVFIAITFVTVLKAKVPRRKWLWAIAVLVGVGQLSFNWTTGETAMQPLSIVLLGGAFFKAGLYGPLTLTCALPIGALLFHWKRHQWRAIVPQPPISGGESTIDAPSD